MGIVLIVAATLFCVIFAFVVTGRGGKIFLGSLIIVMAFTSLTFPQIRMYLNLGAVLMGLCCFIYLIGKGYLHNIRLFRGKASHDKY
jgi:hypothetical protein